jgi:hypothetical protein
MSGRIGLGFVVRGYPGSGRRVEAESDLSGVDGPDLLQGAFMGDAVLELGDVDLSTRFGWVTLIDWCVRLATVLGELRRHGQGVIGFSESDDFLSCRRHADMVFLAGSYRSGIAAVRHADFDAAVREFIDDRMGWVAREFPGAMRNSAMADVLARIDRGLDR